MRTARPPPLQNPSRSAHGGLRVHRRLVQPPSPPFRPRLSFTDQLRKDSANTKSNRKPNTVHRNGVAPPPSCRFPGWVSSTRKATSPFLYFHTSRLYLVTVRENVLAWSLTTILHVSLLGVQQTSIDVG